MRILWSFIVLFMLFSSSVNAQSATEDTELGINRCINLGNMLEAPFEGDWGLRVEESYFETIAEAGFDSVRIPIRWSTHRNGEAIDERFLSRIYEVLGWALDANLNVILNVHHYEEMMSNPEDEFEQLMVLWEQIAAAFADYPDSVLFELLNEPHDNLDFNLWNEYYPQLIEIIRKTNPTRSIIVGGDDWNSANALNDLVLPRNTDNLIVTFHFYEPFEFTHQGAEWVEDSEAWLGTTFGSTADYRIINNTFDEVVAWGAARNVPILLGEFGAYSRADFEQRIAYTQAVREAAEEHDIAWCYWEFASTFGIYDVETETFNGLYPALIPEALNQ